MEEEGIPRNCPGARAYNIFEYCDTYNIGFLEYLFHVKLKQPKNFFCILNIFICEIFIQKHRKGVMNAIVQLPIGEYIEFWKNNELNVNKNKSYRTKSLK